MTISTRAEDLQEPLVRRLSAFGLWLLIVNGMIAAGIFGVPAEAPRLAGAFSPWGVSICGFLQLPILLCFPRLGPSFPGTVGPVFFAPAASGPPVGVPRRSG